MDEATNTYSIGVFGNQVAAASTPTFGATMLNTLAQKITGESTLKIEFRNNQLPINNAMYPTSHPPIAEVFGVSVLAATIYLMSLQAKWHGKPVNSGFYEAFLLKGGYPRGYLCSKYLKAVCSNLAMVAVLILLIFGQKFILDAAPIIFVVWCFVNPLFVLATSNTWAISMKTDYKYVQKRLIFLTGTIGMLAYISAGTIAFSQGGV